MTRRKGFLMKNRKVFSVILCIIAACAGTIAVHQTANADINNSADEKCQTFKNISEEAYNKCVADFKKQVAAQPPEYLQKLVTCTPYYKEENMAFSPIVKISGWSGGKCLYETYPKDYPGSKTTCRYTKEQLNEIKAAMQKNQSELETYSYNGMNYTSTPINVVLTKFTNDPNTCTLPN